MSAPHRPPGVTDAGVAPLGAPSQRIEAIYLSEMGAMGVMAATLAHELNQPLSTVANYIAGCRRLLADAATGSGHDFEQLFAALASAEAEAMRAGKIVRRMRELVGGPDGKRRSESLAGIIDQACRIAAIGVPEARIESRPGPEPMRVAVDRVAIQHVIVSLLRTGLDDGRAGVARTLVVEARDGEPGFAEVRITDLTPAGSGATGSDPFSAVGVHAVDDIRIRLAICRTIVESHGGRIGLENANGDQACFALTLPLCLDPPEALRLES